MPDEDIHVGDATKRTVLFKNSAGVATDPTTTTATLTLPDGTTSSPAITNEAADGTFSVTITPTMSGNHILKWTGTGAVAEVEPDEFDVRPIATINLTDIVSLGEVKRAIGGFSGTTYNEELRRWITAVSARVDELYGPVVIRTITDEAHTGVGSMLFLRHHPVAAITSVKEYASGVETTLTAESFGTAGTYLLNTTLGTLTRRSGWATTAFGASGVLVSYTAGRYANTAAVGQRWKTAVLDVLRRRWARESPAWARSSQFAEIGEPVGPLFFNATDSALRELLGSPMPAIA